MCYGIELGMVRTRVLGLLYGTKLVLYSKSAVYCLICIIFASLLSLLRMVHDQQKCINGCTSSDTNIDMYTYIYLSMGEIK